MNPTDQEYPEILTAHQIAKVLQLSRRRVYELLQMNPLCGGMKSFDIGRSVRVRKESFVLWINQQEVEKKKRWREA